MPIHGARRNAEHPRGLKLVARALLDRRLHQPSRGFMHGRADGNGNTRAILRCRRFLRRAGNFWRENKAGDGFIVAQCHRPLNDVLEFPDIAGPGVRQQLIHCRRGDGADVIAHDGGKSAQEMSGQQRDVLPPFAQRRQNDLHCVDSVIQIVPEFSLGDGSGDVGMGGAEQPHVDLNFLRAAEPLKHFRPATRAAVWPATADSFPRFHPATTFRAHVIGSSK